MQSEAEKERAAGRVIADPRFLLAAPTGMIAGAAIWGLSSDKPVGEWVFGLVTFAMIYSAFWRRGDHLTKGD